MLLVVGREGRALGLEEVRELIKVEVCRRGDLGDFSSNIALVLCSEYEVYIVEGGKWEVSEAVRGEEKRVPESCAEATASAKAECPHGWRREHDAMPYAWTCASEAQEYQIMNRLRSWQNEGEYEKHRGFSDGEYLPCGCLAMKEGAIAREEEQNEPVRRPLERLGKAEDIGVLEELVEECEEVQRMLQWEAGGIPTYNFPHVEWHQIQALKRILEGVHEQVSGAS